MGKINVEPIEKYALSKDAHASVNKKHVIKKLGIIGCGLVGQNIARIAAANALDVVYVELTEERVKETRDEIASELDYMIGRWGMTGSEKKIILSKIRGTIDYEELAESDFIIEVIRSRTRKDAMKNRKNIFSIVEDIVRPETIIATNSPTLIITELASFFKYPERFIGLHFISPNTGSGVVEVAKGLYTSDETYNSVMKFSNLLGKQVIPLNESPGGISTRIIVPMLNEACEILMEGVGTIENIDKTMKVGFGMPLGPFEMADKIGLDKILVWMDNLYDEFGDVKYKASPLLRRLVRAQQFGRRTGKGFYEYEQEESQRIIK